MKLRNDRNSDFKKSIYMSVIKVHLTVNEVRNQLLNIFRHDNAGAQENWNHLQKQKRQEKSKKVLKFFNDLGRIDPPPLDQTEVELEIVFTNDPGSFWVQYTDPENQIMIREIESGISMALEKGYCRWKGRNNYSYIISLRFKCCLNLGKFRIAKS